MNNIWEFKVTKLGANEVYYLAIKQDDVRLNKKQINQILQHFRNDGYSINLRGYGYQHYLNYINSIHMFKQFEYVLNAINTMKFHRETISFVNVTERVLIDRYYITSDEYLSLICTPWMFKQYEMEMYTFIGNQLPRKLACGLLLRIAKNGNYYYKGKLVYEIDKTNKTVAFYNEICKTKQIVQLQEF